MDIAYPNPFNPKINFDINMPSLKYIEIDIYDIMGHKVDVIFSGYLNKGKYSFNWDGKNNATGLYFIKATTQNNSLIQKITLIK